MVSLTGKAALVTGTSSGLGRATALRLAALGMRVTLAARNKARLDEVAAAISVGGGTALVIATDVTEPAACQRAVEETVASFGGLDLLLCSAGLSMRCPFDEAALSAMEQVVRVNFFGTLYATHFALPHIKKSRGGLVAISSLTGKRGIPTYAAYGASKFAIQGLYEALQVGAARRRCPRGHRLAGFRRRALRKNVLGPDGTPWTKPPEPPFRIWPMTKCVDRIIRLILKRRREVLLPWYAGPLIGLDRLLGRRLGDLLLSRKFR